MNNNEDTISDFPEIPDVLMLEADKVHTLANVLDETVFPPGPSRDMAVSLRKQLARLLHAVTCPVFKRENPELIDEAMRRIYGIADAFGHIDCEDKPKEGI